MRTHSRVWCGGECGGAPGLPHASQGAFQTVLPRRTATHHLKLLQEPTKLHLHHLPQAEHTHTHTNLIILIY